MKISKSGLLNVSLIFTVLGLGLTAVSMAQRQLYVDLSNASQYMEKVQFISTGSKDSAFLQQIGNGSVKIQTNNFILSKTGNDENIISGAYYSSILGGIKNKIEGIKNKGANVIIGGSENLINGEYNVILGGEKNKIENGKYSTILGGKDNELSGNYSVVLGSKNKIEGTGSVVVGQNGYVKGDYSAALGNNSKVEANNSFLWTDGSTTESLTQNNVFVVMAKSGMIINTNQAQNFAKLTIGGPLVLSSKSTDENIQCGTGNGGGILKVKNAGSQMCLCSCDGSGWNSMLGKGKCMGICDSSIKPQCGNNVQRIKVGDHIEYSGSCNFGVPAKGTGAYLVTKDDKVHWSCQTDDGQVVGCSGTATGLPYKTCGIAPSGEGVKLGNSIYVEGFGGGNTTWTYTENENLGICEWTCLTGYSRDGFSCKKNQCQGTLPEGVTLNNPGIEPSSPTNYFCDTESTLACSYTCPDGYTCNSAGTGCKLSNYGECENSEPYGCKDPLNTVVKVDTTGDNQRKRYCRGEDGDSPMCTHSCDEGETLEWISLHIGICKMDSPGGSLCCEALPLHAEKVTAEQIRYGADHDGFLCGIVGRCEWNHATPAIYACPYHTEEDCRYHGDTCQWLEVTDGFICDSGYTLIGCECKNPSGGSTSCRDICLGDTSAIEYNNSCYRTCFAAGTKVTISDGTQKNIEDIKIGEKVLGSNGTINTVLGYDRPILGNRHLWSINGGEYFVSDEHPFMTTQGWKSFNPEMTKLEIDLDTKELKVGDVLITENGEEEIKSVDYMDADYNTPLFNLVLDGDHTYYANNYLVHNKEAAYEIGSYSSPCPNRVPRLDGIGQKCCGAGFTHFYNGRCVIECPRH